MSVRVYNLFKDQKPEYINLIQRLRSMVPWDNYEPKDDLNLIIFNGAFFILNKKSQYYENITHLVFSKYTTFNGHILIFEYCDKKYTPILPDGKICLISALITAHNVILYLKHDSNFDKICQFTKNDNWYILYMSDEVTHLNVYNDKVIDLVTSIMDSLDIFGPCSLP